MTIADKEIEAGLLPCPFCGGDAYGPIFSQEVGAKDIWEVECRKCCYSIEGTSERTETAAKEAAIEAWNTRTALNTYRPSQTPAEDGLVERLRDLNRQSIAGFVMGGPKQTIYAKAADEILILRSRSDRMKEALDPFAKLADGWDDQADDQVISDVSLPVTIGDCRRARTALGEGKK